MLFSTQQVNPVSYARFFNAVTDTDSITIFINDIEMPKALGYGDFTEYDKALAGRYNIKVHRSDGVRIIDQDIVLDAQIIYTLAVIGEGSHEIELIPDTKKAVPSNMSAVRFINLSSEVTPVDVYMNDVKLFSDLNYKEYTNYVPLTPGTYTVRIDEGGLSTPVLTAPNIKLQGGKFYAVIFAGKRKGQPPLQIFVPLEGTTYLQF